MSSAVALKGVLQCIWVLGKDRGGCTTMLMDVEAEHWYAMLKGAQCSCERGDGGKTHISSRCSK